MAEIVAFALGQVIDLAVREASKIAGAREELWLLQSELLWMHAFLDDPDANIRMNGPRSNLYTDQVQEITSHAERVIIDFVIKNSLLSEKKRRIKGLFFFDFFPACLCSPSKSRILRRLDKDIRVINGRINRIANNKSRYGVEDVPNNPAEASSGSSNVGVPSSTVCEDGAEYVRQMLLFGHKRRMVVSIVGESGCGKTTLAENVFGDAKQRFHCHAVVHVSREYGAKDLLVKIAKGINLKLRFEDMDVRVLGTRIRDFLTPNKYCIFLDDVCSKEAWDDLHSYLPDRDNGSRILLTSCDKDVALYADSQSVPRELQPLNSTERWHLFVRMVFGATAGSTSACPPELAEVGEKIVEKCAGMPLAIVVIGGLLSRKEKTCFSWQRVLDRVNWHLSQGPNSCMGILELSYNDLPSYLKSCFLCCACFPEACEKIKARKLIDTWVARGIVESRGEGNEPRDTAEDYLEELLLRNMIQVTSRRSEDGGVKSCRIHDLFRDLAISKILKEFIGNLESILSGRK